MEERKDTQPLTLDEEQARELRELLKAANQDARNALERLMQARLNHDTGELIAAVKDAPAGTLELLLRGIEVMRGKTD